MRRQALVCRFALHTLAGAFLFSLIGGATAHLNWGTLRLEHSGISPLVLLTPRGLEAFLFSADCLCLLVFVTAETWTFLRDVVASAVRSRDDEASSG